MSSTTVLATVRQHPDPPAGNQPADGSYRPSLAPVNFTETTKGAQYQTVWYTGPLSPANHRARTR